MQQDYFRSVFGEPPEADIFVPGRVNLIGEHIDYNGGVVLPFAIGRGITIEVGRRADQRWVISSDRFRDKYESGPGEAGAGWAQHALAALQLAIDEGWASSGFNISVTSNLPDGAGLSSSAALIVGVLKAIRALNGLELSNTEVAVLARRVENDYLGVPVGIMDQMAVSIACPGEAILLNTQSLDFKTIPLPTDLRFIPLHSGVRRELSDGRYRERKEECDAAKAFFSTDDLCHLSLESVEAAESLPAELKRRVRHCVTENTRVHSAVAALKTRDHRALGDLMTASHRSMREDFEMSLPAIDALVDTALDAGALGARLTGGGFGGCIVAAVPADIAARWQEQVLAQHPQAFAVEAPT